MYLIGVILDIPLLDDTTIKVEVIQDDFMQGKFKLMLRPKLYVSDLDDLHKSQCYEGPWARANKVQLDDAQEGRELRSTVHL